MKIFIVLFAGLFALSASLPAQDNQSPGPGADGPGWKKHGRPHGPPPEAGLSPDEQRRLSAAREKAKNDPTVQSLREARDAVEKQLEAAMRGVMLSADPSLAPVLDKIQAARSRAKEMRGKFEALTPEQRNQLKQARRAAKDDPAVQAARAKLDAAENPQARRAAAKEMREAMKAAVLKSNPDLAPLLDQLRPGMMGPRPGPGGPGPMGPPGAGGPPDGPMGEADFE